MHIPVDNLLLPLSQSEKCCILSLILDGEWIIYSLYYEIFDILFLDWKFLIHVRGIGFI